MIKRLTALLLAVISLLTLAACGEKQLLIDPAPPEEQTEAPPQEHAVTPQKTPEVTAPDSVPADDAGLVRRIDPTFLISRGMTVDSVFLASSDVLFIFTSHVRSGVLSETSYLYTYSLTRDKFTGRSMPLGIVGQYPRAALDDGAVPVMTLNTETYEADALLLIDPQTLEYEQIDLRGLRDVRNVDVSPDRSMTAVSSSDALTVVRGFDFTDVIARYEGFTAPDGDALLDYKLPTAIGWMPEGGALLGKLLGWEWVEHVFLLDPAGGRTDIDGYDYLSAEPLTGGHLLIYDDFRLLPSGVLDVSDGSFEPFDPGGLPGEEDERYISAMAVTSDGQLALAVADPEGDEMCRADFYHGQSVVRSFALEKGDGWPVSFESLTLSPDGKEAALLTCATVDQPKAIYYTRLP